MDNKHHITITGIVVKDGKFLITKRAANKRLFPSMWTVPGGNLEVEDYINSPKDTDLHWYNILEKVLRREVKLETGIDLKNIKYLTSMTLLAGEDPMLILSLYADYAGGEVKLNDESVEHAWIGLEEAKNYELIPGIYEELVMLDKILKGEEAEEWSKDTDN